MNKRYDGEYQMLQESLEKYQAYNIKYAKQVEGLEQDNKRLIAENTTLTRRIEVLEERNSLLVRKLFGRSSERGIAGEEEIAEQPSLFNEAEMEVEEERRGEDKGEQEVRGYKRKVVVKHKRGGEQKLPEGLPRVEEVIDISEEEKRCECGHELVKIGEDVSERLELVPEHLEVRRTIRYKYACPCCHGAESGSRAVKEGALPPAIIPGSIAGASLIAYILERKYMDMVPYYRQEGSFKRRGIDISRQDMSNWQMKVGEKLEPLVMVMKERMKEGRVMRMDESRLQVMGEEGRSDSGNSWMWVGIGGVEGKRVVIFEYNETRGSKHIYSFLEGFSGWLQTDGYDSYDAAAKLYPRVIQVGCFAHARRNNEKQGA
jgi:transposase